MHMTIYEVRTSQISLTLIEFVMDNINIYVYN
jgi:hypothetical protein